MVITGKAAVPPSSSGADRKPVPPYNTDGIDPDSCSDVLIENYECGAGLQHSAPKILGLLP